MEESNGYWFQLWNYALMMYRTMLIKAESRRRKAIVHTEDWNNNEIRKVNRLHSHQNQSEGHQIDIVSGDHVQDPAAAVPSRKMCPCDKVEMKRVFDLFDENKDGVISAEDLQLYMKRLGFNLSDQKVRKMVRSFDRNKDENVDFEDFFSMYCPVTGDGGESKCHHSLISREKDEEEEEDTLLRAFFVFDENKDGFISKLELQQVLLKLGMREGRSLLGCQKMIKKVDADGNGKVDFFEFKRMMRSNSFVFCR